MFGAKKTERPGKHDYTKLDKAVSELAQQTKVLLGSKSPAIKKQKPHLPAKQAAKKLHTKGQSFDILPKKQPAQISSLQPAGVKEEERAVPHSAKTILIRPETVPESEEFEEPEAAKPQLIPESKPAVVVPPSNNQKSLLFEDPKATEEPADTTAESSQVEAAAQPVQVSYGNTITSTAKPVNTSLEEEDKKTAISVYDTDEYHQPLHDWSRLEQRSRWPLVILFALLIVAAAGGWYFFVRGN